MSANYWSSTVNLDFFSSIFSDRLYIQILSGVSLSPNRHSRQVASLREHLFIAIDENSGPVQR